MLSITTDTFCFLINMPFCFFSLALARTSIMMFNRNNQNEHPRFVSSFGEKAISVLLLSILLVIGFWRQFFSQFAENF